MQSRTLAIFNPNVNSGDPSSNPDTPVKITFNIINVNFRQTSADNTGISAMQTEKNQLVS